MVYDTVEKGSAGVPQCPRDQSPAHAGIRGPARIKRRNTALGTTIRRKSGAFRNTPEQLKALLANIPPSPLPGDEKDFPSAADRLLAHTALPAAEAPPADASPALSAGEGGERRISYSLNLTEAAEEWVREAAALAAGTFSARLTLLLAEKHIRPPAFYRAAGIDRKLFSAIRRDYGYQPSRETAIRCCLALRLNIEETEELLKSAGYALSPARRFDLVIRWCVENGVWNVDRVNALLDELGEKTFRC